MSSISPWRGNVAARPVVSWMSDISAMFQGLFLTNDAKSSPPIASGCVSLAIGGVLIVSGPPLADVIVTGSPVSAAGPVLTDTQSTETLTPDKLAAYLDGIDRPPGWDVVALHPEGIPASEYAAAGATWLVEGIDPNGNWIDVLRQMIRRGPRAGGTAG